MLPLGPVMDYTLSGRNPYTDYDYSYDALYAIGMTCFIAIGVGRCKLDPVLKAHGFKSYLMKIKPAFNLNLRGV